MDCSIPTDAELFSGVFLGAMYMTSFSFVQRSHMGHHRRNRSDFEMFDLYYAHESRLKKTLFLYLIMIGFFWLSLPLTTIIFIIWPGILQTRPFHLDVSIGGMLRGMEKSIKPRLRLESLFTLLFHGLLFYLLNPGALAHFDSFSGSRPELVFPELRQPRLFAPSYPGRRS